MNGRNTKKLENDHRFTEAEKETVARCLDVSATWDEDACATVCKLADMAEEYAVADGDTFESVVFTALAKLGYEYGE